MSPRRGIYMGQEAALWEAALAFLGGFSPNPSIRVSMSLRSCRAALCFIPHAKPESSDSVFISIRQ